MQLQYLVCKLCKITYWIYPLYAEKKTRLHNLEETQTRVMCLHEVCSQITSAYLDVALENRSSKMCGVGDCPVLIVCLWLRTSLKQHWDAILIVRELLYKIWPPACPNGMLFGVESLICHNSVVLYIPAKLVDPIVAYSNWSVVIFYLEPRK